MKDCPIILYEICTTSLYQISWRYHNILFMTIFGYSTLSNNISGTEWNTQIIETECYIQNSCISTFEVSYRYVDIWILSISLVSVFRKWRHFKFTPQLRTREYGIWQAWHIPTLTNRPGPASMEDGKVWLIPTWQLPWGGDRETRDSEFYIATIAWRTEKQGLWARHTVNSADNRPWLIHTLQKRRSR
jgi:hypothetical protein